MLLILLRHGIAEPADQFPGPDSGRPLTARGQTRTFLACRGLWTQIPSAPVVVSSPMLRARQTATILRETAPEMFAGATPGIPTPGGATPGCASPDGPGTGSVGVEIWPELQDTPTPELQEKVWGHWSSVLVCVGHEPHLTQLACQLWGVRGSQAAIELKKCGALALELEPLGRTVTLVWHLAPCHLRALAPA